MRKGQNGRRVLFSLIAVYYYFRGARSKGFATLRNVSKLPFFDKVGHARSVGFRFYFIMLCHGNAEVPHDAAVITLSETA